MQIAFYFAFTQSYFAFMIFPAAFGAAAWVFFGHYSAVYAIASTLWCIVFTEFWRHEEVDLAIRWGVRGVSAMETKRKDFEHERETTDPVTGEKMQIFPATKRLQRQLLQIPFAIGAASVLGTLIAVCFGIEIFISEVYNGPLKSVLVSFKHVRNATSWLIFQGFPSYWNLDYVPSNFDWHLHQLRRAAHEVRKLRE